MAVTVATPSVHLSQGTVVLGALLFGFVLWLAVNQRLGTYWSILIGGGGTAASGGGSQPAPQTSPTQPAPAPAPNTSWLPNWIAGPLGGLGGTVRRMFGG